MLIVDAANVVGSRPDGWWRDRAGAAARLIGRIGDAVAAGRLDGPVTVVLEGAARAADAPGGGAVRLVSAAGSGDDAIVEVAAAEAGRGSPVVVATADRELRRRVEAVGASAVAPGWLLDRLDPPPGQPPDVRFS